jgi:hypothetical protein
LLRFIGKNASGEPVVMLLDLAELDLKDSVDGSSPDALCIFKCCERALDDALSQHTHPAVLGSWLRVHSGWQQLPWSALKVAGPVDLPGFKLSR